MKNSLFLTLMLLASTALGAQSQLSVIIDGIDKVQGNIFVAAYDSANFLKTPVYGQIKTVDSTTVTVVFDSIPTGSYAISVFHDENGNNALDRGTYGIPAEKTGFSNNIVARMGPPRFSDCMIKVEDAETSVYITLR
jgi:uncharacterized protein (DUF2141 family)